MAIEEVKVIIPQVPGQALSPNVRTYWGTYHKQAKFLRKTAMLATLGQLTGAEREWIFMNVKLGPTPSFIMDCHIAWPKGRRKHDDDNAWTMIKPARDGFAEACRINDAVIRANVMTQSRGVGEITLTFRKP